MWDSVNPQHAHFRSHVYQEWWDMWVARHRAMIGSLGIEPETVLEWGIGGGANASLLPDTQYHGVDVSLRSLGEACRYPHVVVWLHDGDPRDTLAFVPEVGLFICTAVIQHMPSHADVELMLRAAYAKVRPGGRGLVQTRSLQTRKSSYAEGWQRWVCYSPDRAAALLRSVGWSICERRDVRPDYSYFLLAKPERANAVA